jgi:hypothetical protein
LGQVNLSATAKKLERVSREAGSRRLLTLRHGLSRAQVGRRGAQYRDELAEVSFLELQLLGARAARSQGEHERRNHDKSFTPVHGSILSPFGQPEGGEHLSFIGLTGGRIEAEADPLYGPLDRVGILEDAIDKNSLWGKLVIQKGELCVKAILVQDLGFVRGP